MVALAVAAMCCASVMLAFGPSVCFRVAPAFVPIACAVAFMDADG